MFKDGTLHSPYKFDIAYPQEETAVEYLLNQAGKHCKDGRAQHPWITDAESGKNVTFGEIEPLSRKVASAFFKRGFRKGDVVLYCSHEASRLHVFFIGVWRANGALQAVYPEDTAETMLSRLLQTGAKWLLCDPEATAVAITAARQAPWRVEVITYGDVPGCVSADEFLNDKGDACPRLEVRGDDIGLILSTSGTTGASKGAIHTQLGLAKMFAIYGHCVVSRGGGKMLVLGKPTHISGSCFPMAILAAAKGAEGYMMRNITKESLFQAVHRYKPSMVFGFPTFLLHMANGVDASDYDFSSVTEIATGGVVVTPSFIRTMETAIPTARVLVMYGMTECGFFTSSANYDPDAEMNVWPNVPDFSVGKLAPATSLQVRNLETGEPLGPNQRGELCFQSPIVCGGYLNNQEANEKTFPNGWVRTGDVGYFDENGFIFVVDRLKEVFKYYNNHISPSEIEDVIQRHPAVNNVSVIGIPDPAGGDTIPRAFVSLKDPKVSAHDILKFSNDNLPSYKHLRGGLIVLPELPVGKTGKVTRQILQEIQICIH